jgi:hypothetical protein
MCFIHTLHIGVHTKDLLDGLWHQTERNFEKSIASEISLRLGHLLDEKRDFMVAADGQDGHGVRWRMIGSPCPTAQDLHVLTG